MRMLSILLVTIFAGSIAIIALSSTVRAVNGGVLDTLGNDLMNEQPENYPIATLAGGCFWCIESEFRVLDGVLYTRVGYIGGTLENPTYKDITTGETGHAEAVEITFDPDKISYKDLVTFFLTKAHDPTQINRQGVDVGTQYRSEIFYHSEEQKRIAEALITEINAQKLYNAPIATKVSEADEFWLAEGYHQQFYEKYEKQNGKVHPRVFFKKTIKTIK